MQSKQQSHPPAPFSESPFDPLAYWSDRLDVHAGLEGVGHIGLGDDFNQLTYRVKSAVFRRVAGGLNLDPSARILDIGSGEGFALREWQRLGFAGLVGSDFTDVAIQRLRSAFQCEIRHLDITADPEAIGFATESFDALSAIDVLYHVVDDELFRKALRNIGHLLKPGGYFLLADNFVHGPTQRVPHQVSHSLATLEEWLEDAGMEIQERRPQYVLMNYPTDSQSKALHLSWRLLSRFVRRWPRISVQFCRPLVPMEILLTRLLREGPSTELAVCRKRGW